MSHIIRRGALVAAMSAMVMPAALASNPARSPHVVFERNLSLTGDWHGGEPQVAVHGNDVAVVWPEVDATGIYRNPATGTLNYGIATGVGYANDPSFSRCGLSVSHDAGRTFRRTTLPAVTAQSTLCSDAVAAFGPKGELYAATITFNQPTFPLPLVPPGTLPDLWSNQPGQGSADVVVRSQDGGDTWTAPPVDAIGNRGAAGKRYAPGSNPPRGGEGTSDRPFIAVDPSDGTLYLTASSSLVQFNGTIDTRSFVTASTDHGRSFGLVYAVDDPNWKQSGIATIAAAGGRLVVAYPGTNPEGVKGVVVAVSRDKGRTFKRRLLATTLPSGALSFAAIVAADPGRVGTIAVAVPTDNEIGINVHRSRDFGASWAHPEQVGVGTSRPWLAFSPRGRLGLMGRDIHSDSSQDVLLAIADPGESFLRPIRVNRQTTPAPPPGALALYDDISGIVMTDAAAWVTWGDWRKSPQNTNGEVQAWLGEVALPAITKSTTAPSARPGIQASSDRGSLAATGASPQAALLALSSLGVAAAAWRRRRLDRPS